MARWLNVGQLEAFRAVMLSGSTTRAAAVLGLSQPSISRLINELEARLGTPLFVRGHGRLTPTEEAQWLFSEAEDVLSGLDRLDLAARDIRHLSVGELRLIASPPMAYALAPECLGRLSSRFPSLRVTLQVTFRREARSWTDAQRFDVALTTFPIDYPRTDREHLVSAAGACIVPPTHALAKKEVIDAADLADEPFISPLPETFHRFRLDRLFDTLGIRRSRMTVEAQTSLTICQLVAAGHGVAVVDPFTARTFASFGYCIRPFRPAFTFDYGILFPIRRPRSRLAEVFAETVRQVVAENPLYGQSASADATWEDDEISARG